MSNDFFQFENKGKVQPLMKMDRKRPIACVTRKKIKIPFKKGQVGD